MLHLHSIILHFVVIQAHEDDIDGNADCDKELNKGIKDNEGHQLRDFDPGIAAIQNTEGVTSLLQGALDHILQLGPLIVILGMKR